MQSQDNQTKANGQVCANARQHPVETSRSTSSECVLVGGVIKQRQGEGVESIGRAGDDAYGMNCCCV